MRDAVCLLTKNDYHILPLALSSLSEGLDTTEALSKALAAEYGVLRYQDVYHVLERSRSGAVVYLPMTTAETDRWIAKGKLPYAFARDK